nr:hypothetical protein [Bacteroidota bacterium]
MQNKPKLFSEFPPISIAEWEKQIRKDLKGQDYDKKLLWETLDGFILKPYYSEKDLLPLDYLNSISPHLMPSDGHLISNSWIMHQEILESDPLKANKLAVKAIKGGMNHISFNASEIKNLSKLNVLLKGIDIIEISIGFYNQECNRFLRNLLTEFAVSNNFNKLKIRGNFEADPYGILLSTGDYRENPGQLKRHYYELIDSLDTHLPNFRGITIHGQQFHNGGATSTQELAYVLALGVEYLSMLTEQELPIDSITPFLQLSFGIGSDYFIEIAKIRAARLLWSKMVEQYSPKKKDS